MKFLSWLFYGLFVLLLISCKQKKNDPPVAEPAQVKNNEMQQVYDSFPNLYAAIDISPMDVSYYPAEYPKLKMAKAVSNGPLARVLYSRPHLGGRRLFESILKYDEPWRLGANEATEIHLFRDAVIQGKKVSAGRYVLYCIPQEDKWTIVFNSNIDTWGLEPDIANDVARFEIPVTQTSLRLEYFTMIFEGKDKDAELLMAWDDVQAKLSLRF